MNLGKQRNMASLSLRQESHSLYINRFQVDDLKNCMTLHVGFFPLKFLYVNLQGDLPNQDLLVKALGGRFHNSLA